MFTMCNAAQRMWTWDTATREATELQNNDGMFKLGDVHYQKQNQIYQRRLQFLFVYSIC